MSDNPQFDASWSEAEAAVFRKLCAAANSDPEKNAFLGYLPPMVNVWSLTTGPDGGNAQTLWTPSVVSVHIQATIEGVFADRAKAQAFVMACVRSMHAMGGADGVQAFRVRQGGFPEPKPERIQVANSDRYHLVWRVMIGCELVFSTGGSA